MNPMGPAILQAYSAVWILIYAGIFAMCGLWALALASMLSRRGDPSR
jgi:hypothetical protein